MKRGRLYFAYGSNLNAEDWNDHVRAEWPDRDDLLHDKAFKPFERARLWDRELAFTYRSMSRGCGVLDLRPRAGAMTAGMLFEPTDAAWEVLERKEGASRPGRRANGNCYERVPCVVRTDSGEKHEAETFVVAEARRESFVEPNDRYLEVVRAGLKRWNLPDDDLLAASRNEPVELRPNRLFVYDDLMRGGARHHRLREHGLNVALLAEVWGRLVTIDGTPTLLPPEDDADPRRPVQGELVGAARLSELLERLDEEARSAGAGRPPGWLERVPVEVGMCDGHVREAWTYRYVGPIDDFGNPAGTDCRPVPSLDWRAHRGVRRQVLEAIVREHAEGNEKALAAALVGAHAIPPRDARKAARTLLPLAETMARGEIGEREIALVTQKWAVPVEPPAGGEPDARDPTEADPTIEHVELGPFDSDDLCRRWVADDRDDRDEFGLRLAYDPVRGGFSAWFLVLRPGRSRKEIPPYWENLRQSGWDRAEPARAIEVRLDLPMLEGGPARDDDVHVQVRLDEQGRVSGVVSSWDHGGIPLYWVRRGNDERGGAPELTFEYAADRTHVWFSAEPAAARRGWTEHRVPDTGVSLWLTDERIRAGWFGSGRRPLCPRLAGISIDAERLRVHHGRITSVLVLDEDFK
jgi:hypothetical protein